MSKTESVCSDPLKLNELPVLQNFDTYHSRPVECISQMMYDALRVHCPYTIYAITDIPGKVYMGDVLIAQPSVVSADKSNKPNDTDAYSSMHHRVYTVLNEYYISYEIGFLEALLSCMSILGYRDTPELQVLMQLQKDYRNINNHEYNIPMYVINHITTANSTCSKTEPFNTYDELYRVLYSYIHKNISTDELNMLAMHICRIPLLVRLKSDI